MSYTTAPKTAVSHLVILCSLATQKGCYTEPPARPAVSLPALIAALSDGPIQIHPATLPQRSVSAAIAAQAAQTSIGVRYSKARAWPVAFTDRENLSRPGVNLLCWLLASSQPFTLPLANEFAPKRTLRRETLYVVINARTGVIVEAFSKPRVAWWRRVLVTNEAHVLETNKQDQTAFPAIVPPRLPLARPFAPSASDRSPDLTARFGGREDQVIARYFVFTDLGSKMLHIPGSTEFQYEFIHQPVWYLCLDGLNTPIGGPVMLPALSLPPPMFYEKPGSVRIPRSEELSTAINAATGDCFSTLLSRNGRQVDKF